MTAKEIIITIAGYILFIALATEGVARLRDALVDQGWISANGRLKSLYQMTLRRRRVATLFVLKEIGFNGYHFAAIKDALLQEKIAKQINFQGSNRSFEDRLIVALRLWVREGRYQREDVNNTYYIDTMGAMYYAQSHSVPLWEMLEEWTGMLRKSGLIPPFDCVISNKDGNSRMVDHVCARLGIAPIVCKGEKDSARPTGDVNRLDFEGLDAFLDKHYDQITRAREDTTALLRAIVIDDNCLSGKSLCSIVRRFNRLIDQEQLPFYPIESAVTLFAIRSAQTQQVFEQARTQLFTVLSLTNEHIRLIKEGTQTEITQNISKMKEGFGVVALPKIFK